MGKRVVITGLGIIAPNGIGKDEFWQATKKGRSGISKITRFDASQYPTKVAGEVDDFQPHRHISKREIRWMSRFTQFALACARMAVDDAQLDVAEEDCYRVGIALGTAIGGLEVAEKQCEIFYKRGINSVNPFSAIAMNPNSAVGIIAIKLKAKGPNITISTGCSAGLNAIAYGFDTIADNRADVMIAGGSEAPLSPITFDSFCAANIMTKHNGNPCKASRPFEKSRDGYVLGEGGGMVILENLEHALNRGAKIYAEIAGYGMTNESYSMARMEPSGGEVAKTINFALENSGVSAQEIDYVNAHGSSSLLSDRRETDAIKSSLGERAYQIPTSSIKSMIGQALGATGGIQMITSVLTIENNHLPPTINYEEPDPECDLDYVPNQARESNVKTILINSFGMGGNNMSMIVKEYSPQEPFDNLNRL